MSRTKAFVMAATLGVAVIIPNPCPAQPPESDDDLRELIVLLAPESRGGPRPEEVVDAINARRQVIPGGLGEGNPERARLAITRRARGRLLERIVADPDSDEARLQRYVVLRFRPEVNLDALMNALGHNRHVEFIERNKRLRLHASAAPKAVPPSDPLVGSGTSHPASGQWALHLLDVPEAWSLLGRPRGFVGVLDTGLQVDHDDLATFGADAQGNPALGPIREHLSRDYVDVAGNTCGVDELEEKPFADPKDDAAGHGTIISGLIAAQPNGLGVAGICWDCSIEMMRVAPSNSSTIIARATRGLDQVKKGGAHVVNMSFGVAEPACAPGDLRILCVSLKAAAARDIVLVASAGNDRSGLELPAKRP